MSDPQQQHSEAPAEEAPPAQAPVETPASDPAAATNSASPAEAAESLSAPVPSAKSAAEHLHRQSIGNAASLFGGGDDDFFGSSSTSNNDTTGANALAAPPSGPADDFFGAQHTPTQGTVDRPPASATNPADTTTHHSAPDNDTPASLFGESTAADDDWLGAGNSTAAGATPDESASSGYDASMQQYASQDTTAQDAYGNSSWNGYYGDDQQGHYQQQQHSQSYDAYDQSQQGSQYDYSASQQGYDTNSYGTSQHGYDTSTYSQNQQYDYSQQQQSQYDQSQQSSYGTDAYNNAYAPSEASYAPSQPDPYAPTHSAYGNSNGYGVYNQADSSAAAAVGTEPNVYGAYNAGYYSAGADVTVADPYVQPAAAIPPPPQPAPAPAAAASEKSYSYDAPPVSFRSGRKSRGVGYNQQQQQQQTSYDSYGAQTGSGDQHQQHYDYSQQSSGQQYEYSQQAGEQQQYDYSQQGQSSDQAYDANAYGAQDAGYQQQQHSQDYSSYDYQAAPPAAQDAQGAYSTPTSHSAYGPPPAAARAPPTAAAPTAETAYSFDQNAEEAATPLAHANAYAAGSGADFFASGSGEEQAVTSEQTQADTRTYGSSDFYGQHSVQPTPADDAAGFDPEAGSDERDAESGDPPAQSGYLAPTHGAGYGYDSGYGSYDPEGGADAEADTITGHEPAPVSTATEADAVPAAASFPTWGSSYDAEGGAGDDHDTPALSEDPEAGDAESPMPEARDEDEGDEGDTSSSDLVKSLNRMALQEEREEHEDHQHGAADAQADAETNTLQRVSALADVDEEGLGPEGISTPTQATVQLPAEGAEPETNPYGISTAAVDPEGMVGEPASYSAYEPHDWGDQSSAAAAAGDTSDDRTWDTNYYSRGSAAQQQEDQQQSSYAPASSANPYAHENPYGPPEDSQASTDVYDPYAPSSLGHGQPPRRGAGGSAPPPASSSSSSIADEPEGGAPPAPYAAGPYAPASAPPHTSSRDFSSEQGGAGAGAGAYGPFYGGARGASDIGAVGMSPFPSSGGYGEEYASESPYGPPPTSQQDDAGGASAAGDRTYGPPPTAAGSRSAADHHFGAAGPGPAPVSPYEPAYGSADTSMNDSYFRSSSYSSSVGPGAGTGAGAGVGVMPDAAEERRHARIPCITFGVDGKVVTYFPSSSGLSPSPSSSSMPESASAFGGFGAPSSSTQVHVRSLRSLVAPSSYASVFDPTSFPGPVFEGAGAGGGALSRATGASSGANKAKKATLISYLRARADEVAQGLKFLSRDNQADGTTSTDGQKSADRAVLLRLLALIVEHDGKVTDNAKFDEGARELLAESTAVSSSASSTFGGTGAFSSPRSSQTLTTYELTSDFITELQAKLVQGQRREAVQYALERRMWAHAMVIASGLDKETWCRTVGEFMAFELEQEGGEVQDLQTKALKTAYAMFSGQNATQVYDSFRPKVSLANGAAQPGSQPASGWRDSAAAIIANRSAGDSGVLTAMGDGLLLSEFIEAAHVCYLLSPQTSTIGGVDTPGVRATLIGGHNPRASVLYLRDLDSILLTEVYEFIQSLLPTVKGQEVFNGLPHLQAFRLVHAMTLAELGDIARAQKYCEAIAATFKSGKPSPYFHPTLLAQLKEFTTRLCGAEGAGQTAGSGNWMTKKMQKPTLDGVWGALEGRFTKFIAGEEGSTGSAQSSQPPSKAGSAHGGTIGPFSHFSSITADTAGSATSVPSQPTSRAGSAMDFRSHRPESPAIRAASALSMRGMQPLMSGAPIPPAPHSAPRDPYSDWPGSSNSQGKLNSTASSTYGGYGGDAEEGAVAAGGLYGSVNPQNTGSFASSRSSDAGAYEGPFRSHGETSNAPWWSQESSSSSATAGANTSNKDSEAADATSKAEAPGDAPYYGYQPHGATAPQFFSNVEPPPGESADFSSPMDAFSRPASREPSYGNASTASRRFDEEDDDDDLGLGNNSSKRAKEKTSGDKGGSDEAKGGAPAKKDGGSLKPDDGLPKKPELRNSSSTSSWLGRLWGRGPAPEAENKPKKVHLGEEKTFYYDKELKRWVNKAAGDTGTAGTTPPPPPPRAQTASPSVQNGRLGPPAPRSSLDQHHQLTSSSSSGYLRGPGVGLGVGDGPGSTGGAGAGGGGSFGSSFGYGAGAAPPSAPSSIAEEGEYGMGSTSAPASGFGSLGRSGGIGIGGVPPPQRARSNLGDPSVPPASQPPMRPASALASGGPAGLPPPPPSMMGRGPSAPPMNLSGSSSSLSPPPAGGGPPPGGRAGGAKKKPIKARYVVVD
ncbi:hypothetical protein OC844_002962 [Tilletia horrida]|nr:hypothetical protein OC844_002962 [Tilletia horrida]